MSKGLTTYKVNNITNYKYRGKGIEVRYKQVPKGKSTLTIVTPQAALALSPHQAKAIKRVLARVK